MYIYIFNCVIIGNTITQQWRIHTHPPLMTYAASWSHSLIDSITHSPFTGYIFFSHPHFSVTNSSWPLSHASLKNNRIHLPSIHPTNSQHDPQLTRHTNAGRSVSSLSELTYLLLLVDGDSQVTHDVNLSGVGRGSSLSPEHFLNGVWMPRP